MPLAASGVTHQGRRSTNEDAWFVDVGRGLLIVADGMGGHNAGEVASELAVKAIQECVDGGEQPSAALLRRAVLAANERILGAAEREPTHAGMGTTVVAVLIDGARAYYTSVGDSRVYLLRSGHFTQLTRDDSWLAEALDAADEDAPKDLGTHPLRHVLTKVVGLRPDLDVPVGECPLGEGDCLLLCTDGVHGAVPYEQLATLTGSRKSVADIAQGVVKSAMARGATDNVTAVVARVTN